jgi:hypothetical protein
MPSAAEHPPHRPPTLPVKDHAASTPLSANSILGVPFQAFKKKIGHFRKKKKRQSTHAVATIEPTEIDHYYYEDPESARGWSSSNSMTDQSMLSNSPGSGLLSLPSIDLGTKIKVPYLNSSSEESSPEQGSFSTPKAVGLDAPELRASDDLARPGAAKIPLGFAKLSQSTPEQPYGETQACEEDEENTAATPELFEEGISESSTESTSESTSESSAEALNVEEHEETEDDGIEKESLKLESMQIFPPRKPQSYRARGSAWVPSSVDAIKSVEPQASANRDIEDELELEEGEIRLDQEKVLPVCLCEFTLFWCVECLTCVLAYQLKLTNLNDVSVLPHTHFPLIFYDA